MDGKINTFPKLEKVVLFDVVSEILTIIRVVAVRPL